MKPFHLADAEHELSRCLTKARGSVPPLPPSPRPPPPLLPLRPVRLISLSRQDPWSGGHLRHFHAPTTRTHPEARLPAIRWSWSGAHPRISGDAAARLRCATVSRTADSGGAPRTDPIMRPAVRRSWSRPRTAALHRTRELNLQSDALYNILFHRNLETDRFYDDGVTVKCLSGNLKLCFMWWHSLSTGLNHLIWPNPLGYTIESDF